MNWIKVMEDYGISNDDLEIYKEHILNHIDDGMSLDEVMKFVWEDLDELKHPFN